MNIFEILLVGTASSAATLYISKNAKVQLEDGVSDDFQRVFAAVLAMSALAWVKLLPFASAAFETVKSKLEDLNGSDQTIDGDDVQLTVYEIDTSTVAAPQPTESDTVLSSTL